LKEKEKLNKLYKDFLKEKKPLKNLQLVKI